jgi:hypothetical protein
MMNEVERLELEARLMAEFEEQVGKMSDEELETLVQNAPQLSDRISRVLAYLRDVITALAILHQEREEDV